MNFGSRSILGLAFNDRAIQCAQIAWSGSRPAVERLGRYELTVGEHDHPQTLGASLKQYLHEHHFTANRAVVGVPLRWVVTHNAELPPTDGVSARAMLRLQVERLNSDEELNMVYDCAGEPGGTSPTQTLLAGMMWQQIDRITQAMQAAGLTLVGITPTALAVSQTMNIAAGRILLMLAEHGTEFVAHSTDAAVTLRHFRPISAGNGPDQAWSSELRRTCALAGHGAAAHGAVTLVDSVGLDEADQHGIGRLVSGPGGALPESARIPAEVRPEALNGAAAGTRSDIFIPSVSLAMVGRRNAALAVNFERSRLTPPSVRRFGRRQVWAIAAGALVLVGLIGLYGIMHQRESQARRLNEQLKQQEPALKVARTNLAQFSYARHYFQMRLPALDCLKEMTQTFHDGEAIWVTSFRLKDNGRGEVQGKATDQRTILVVLERLKNVPNFSDVLLQETHEGSGRERENVFSISFSYHGGGRS